VGTKRRWLRNSQRQERQGEAKDGPWVLLVDDAAAIRNAIQGVLEDAGIEVVGEAPTGSRAWPWSARSAPTWS
jgi:PleD family two-component response regulator